MAGVLGERDRLQQAMNRELERRVKERTDQLQGANERLAGALHAKQAAAEQLEDQLRFASALLDTIPSPLFYKDDQGVYRDCNRAFAREILGVEREDVIGKTLFELPGSIPADLARLYHQKDMELLSTGGKQSYEATVRVCGGGDRHFLFHKAVFTDAEEQAVGLIGVMLDIHDRKEAEQSIRDHRERLRVVLESILDGVVTTGANGAIRSLNPAAERLLGMPAADAEGRAASEILSIRDNNSDLQIENPTEWALNTTQADREMLADLVLTGADGVDRPVSLTASLIGEEGVVLTFRDETELRAHRREKQRLLVDLRERVKELNCLVQLSQVVEEPGISLEDLMEQAVAILPAAYRFSEQAGAEIVLDDQTYATRPCPPQAPTQSANLQVCGQTVGWVRVFYSGRLPATDGEDIFLPSERVMLDAFTERLGRIAERKRYERELAEVRAAVDGAADGILLLGSDGKPRYSNHAFRELFHCMTEELGCEAPQCLFARESDAEEVAAVIEQEDSWRKELPLQTCTGKGFTGHLRITPVLNRDHRIGTLIAVADVTRQRHLEEQVRNAQKLSAVGQLAAGIAHEINTPTQFVGDNLRFLQEDLSAVLARLVQLRKEIGLDDRQRTAGGEAEELSLVRRTLEEMDLDYLEEEVPDALSQSLEGVERIASIVGAMKDFSHSSGPTEWSQVDLARMVRSTVTIARNEWKYCAKLELDLPEDIPPVPCLADDISQVLLNLLTNAAQAIREKTGDEGDKGCITIAAGVQEDQVEIRVTDTGGGIPEDIRPRVFEPFFTTKEVGDGTGQGLSIAYATVVEAHGGSIGFTTEVGEGTTFIVQLPLRQDGQADEAIAAGNVEESGDE
jgi:PAS domain S-box-containing protein